VKVMHRVEKSGPVLPAQPSHRNAVACCLYADMSMSKICFAFLVSPATTLEYSSDLAVLAPRETGHMFISMPIDLAE